MIAALAVVLSGCTSADPEPEPDPPTSAPSPPASGSLPAPGTADQPAVVEPVDDPLEWQEQGDPVTRSVTAGSNYTLTAARSGRRVTLEGPQRRTFTAPRGFTFNDTLLDEEYAVLVAQDTAETQPSRATVVDLATGSTSTLDGSSNPATTNGGSWALGQGTVFHPTIADDGAYCLAEVDLASGAGQTTYCSESNTGFNQVRITPAGLSLLKFDSGQPSCRTLIRIGEAAIEPFPGVDDCRGWEGMVADDGAVWSVVPDENQIEVGSMRARVDDGYYDLGPGRTGSLIWCSGSAYFSRNQENDTDPAQLLRWDGQELAVVWAAGEGGPSTISAPRCGGDGLAVSLLAESGDLQVSTQLR